MCLMISTLPVIIARRSSRKDRRAAQFGVGDIPEGYAEERGNL